MSYKLLFFLTLFLAISACKQDMEGKKGSIDQKSTPAPINTETIRTHLAELSSDNYEGRMPCMKGGKMAVDYIEQEVKRLGLKPGNKGSFLQDVPLLTLEADIDLEMKISGGKEPLTWKKGKDFVIHSERKVDRVELNNSELVFCGYGIIDEKKGWNDFAGMDMKGKTAVIVVNDPGFGGDDPDFFNGDIMTYAGRWDYKYDMADKVGADGLLIIHTTPTAGYPWFVVESSWTGPQQGLSGIDRTKDCGVKGWITLDKAVELFDNCGLNFTEEMKSARKPGFKPKPMNAKVSAGLDNSIEECVSKNIIATVPGSKYPDEYIVYTAHWDHIGIGKVVKGDSIYNGALDNASGVATLLALAEAHQKTQPERSIMFLFVTAEEQGLLGSEYFVENPTIPLSKVVCNLNLDGVNPVGEMKDLTITGKGHSSMDEYAESAAKAQGRYVMAEQEPEKGYFFRSDHFNFAKKGVPALYAEGGYDHATKGKAYAKEQKDNFVAQKYHAPADEYDPSTWVMEGMVQDAQLYYNIAKKLADSREWPEWYEHSEFSRTNP